MHRLVKCSVKGFRLLDLLSYQLLVLVEALDDDLLLTDDWQEFDPSVEQWLNNHLNVAHLILEWVTACPIEEGRHTVAHLLLDVTLLVVLFHLCDHPLEVHDAALAGIAMVRCVEAHV